MNGKITNINSKLYEAIKYLDTAEENLLANYNDNGAPRDGKQIETVRNRIQSQINFLRDTILPASREEITAINKEIRSREEAEARYLNAGGL